MPNCFFLNKIIEKTNSLLCPFLKFSRNLLGIQFGGWREEHWIFLYMKTSRTPYECQQNHQFHNHNSYSTYISYSVLYLTYKFDTVFYILHWIVHTCMLHNINICFKVHEYTYCQKHEGHMSSIKMAHLSIICIFPLRKTAWGVGGWGVGGFTFAHVHCWKN